MFVKEDYVIDEYGYNNTETLLCEQKQFEHCVLLHSLTLIPFHSKQHFFGNLRSKNRSNLFIEGNKQYPNEVNFWEIFGSNLKIAFQRKTEHGKFGMVRNKGAGFIFIQLLIPDKICWKN